MPWWGSPTLVLFLWRYSIHFYVPAIEVLLNVASWRAYSIMFQSESCDIFSLAHTSWLMVPIYPAITAGHFPSSYYVRNQRHRYFFFVLSKSVPISLLRSYNCIGHFALVSSIDLLLWWLDIKILLFDSFLWGADIPRF